MSERDFLKDLNDIDEKYIREAEPGASSGKRGRIRIWGAAAAAVIVLVVSAGVWMKQNNKRILPAGSEAETRQEEKTAAETAGTLPAGTVPGTSENTEAAREPELATADPAADLLYEDEIMKVVRITKPVSGKTSAEACLAYYTERELLERCSLLVRARVTGITNILLENKQWGGVDQACILTVDPVCVIRGELDKEGPLEVFVNKYINSSLEKLNQSLRTAQVGSEGILMLFKHEYTGYMEALADYTVGDNQRFAIWQKSDGLLYDGSAFPGLSGCADLDQAEAYVRALLADNEPAPADFTLSLQYRYRGESPEYDVAYVFDSKDGSYSRKGSAYYEKEYGGENLSTTLEFDQDFLNKLYHSCKRLAGLPEELSGGERSGGQEWLEIELHYTADGEEIKRHYSGPWTAFTAVKGAREELFLTEMEIAHYIEGLPSLVGWENEYLSLIGQARRLERAKRIVVALNEAFEKQGGAPAYYRGMRFVPGGYLQIMLSPADDETIREIRTLLKDYDNDYLFAEGDNPGKSLSELFEAEGLEFRILEDLRDVDLSSCVRIGEVLGTAYGQYFGSGYEPVPVEELSEAKTVLYTVDNWPDYADGGKYVTNIRITDPAVKLFGLSLENSLEEWKAELEKREFRFEQAAGRSPERFLQVSSPDGLFELTVAFDLTMPAIIVNAPISNRDGIIYD